MPTIDMESPGLSDSTARSKRAGEISILDLIIVLARRKGYISLFALSFAIIAAIISLLLPSSYTATTVILPPQSSSSAGSALLSQFGGMGSMAALANGSLGMKNPNDMQVAMLKSRTVETAMVQRFNLRDQFRVKRMSDAIKLFEDKCVIQSRPKDGLIEISIVDRDPKRAAEMTNAYVEEYRKFSGSLAISEASQRRLFFEQQLVQAKDNLAGAEEALKQTQQNTGMLQMDSQARALIESAASLRAQIAAKEVEIHAMRSYASENNPELLLAEQVLAGWQAQLSRITGNQTGTDDDLLLPKGQVPKAGLEYLRKLRDVKYFETIFELLAKQFEMAKLDEAKQGALIQVVDLAIPPDRRSSPKRTLIVLVATFVGLLLATSWVLVKAAFESAKRDPEYKNRIELLSNITVRKSPFHFKKT
jgi:tyrosine-protein kinase Etk/Wzc